MPTILRFRGLRVVIYSDDHWPAHVHAIGADREAKIALGGEGQRPSLVVNEGLSRREAALALVEIDRREIHGDA